MPSPQAQGGVFFLKEEIIHKGYPLRKRRIGLLGGSFNPPHFGHLKTAITVREALLLDEVWLLISPHNPLKDKRTLAPFADRQHMCQLLAANRPWLKVENYEKRINAQFSVDTAQSLYQNTKNTHFFWIMGADNFTQLHLWKDWQLFMRTMPIVVCRRPETSQVALKNSVAAQTFASSRVPPKAAKCTPPNWRLLSNAEVAFNATSIRTGEAAYKTSLPQAVARYITLKKLYQKPIITV